jgi:hypothetical protein
MAVTFLATILLIGVCASAVFGIKQLKTYVDDEEKKLPVYVTTLVSFLCSAVIMSVNTNLRKVIRDLTIKEKHETYTAYNISVAAKLTITRFFNSAIVPVAVNVYAGDWFKDGGLISDIFTLMISLSFIRPIKEGLNLGAILRFLKKKYYLNQGEKCLLTQEEANK